MADSSSDESDAGFPSLPPSIMLDIDLGSGENDGENQYRVLSDETREEEFQPDIVVKDHDESSSSSSDNEDKVHGASVAVSSHENVMMKKKERQNNADTAGSKADNLVNVADGSTCFKCNDCKGFQMHQWRRVCNSCKCPKEEHELTINDTNEKMTKIHLIDNNENLKDDENILNKYAWFPPGLDAEIVESYMNSLPENQVPRFGNTEGIDYRKKQLLLQFPIQDTNYDSCKTVPQKSKHVFDQFFKKQQATVATGHVERAFRVRECKRCHQDITIGDPYVLAFNLDENASWHPACFSCTNCCELLMNLTYYHHEGEIFCGRHFAEINKPRCSACDEMILFGEYVKASEQAYHVQHFCCWICDAELSGKQHLVEAQQPICIDCYNNKFANSCHKCKKKISMEDKDILYDNHHWHDTCLLCVICNETLSGRSFLTKDNGEFICADCHKQTDTRRCKTCNQGFEPGMKRLELNGVFWHEKCFICELCKEPISSKRFMRHQDLTVCVKCYEDAFIKRCVVCSQPLTQGGISYNDEPYHKECFACVKCNTSIASQAFSVKDGKNYCSECYSVMFAKRCKACNEFILAGEYYTLDEDTWHKQCFTCTKCGEPLASSSFVQEGDEILLMCESCLN